MRDDSSEGEEIWNRIHSFFTCFNLYFKQLRERENDMSWLDGSTMLKNDITVENNIVKMFPLQFIAE